MNWSPGDLRAVALRRPLVHWLTDRESLALAVARDPENNDEPIYKRKSTPDLWARFEYYEKIFRITPEFETRNTQELAQVVDIISSDMRNTMRDYAAPWVESMKFMSAWESAWRQPEQFDWLVDQLNGLGEAEQQLKLDEMQLRYGIQIRNLVAHVASKRQNAEYVSKTIDGFLLPLT